MQRKPGTQAESGMIRVKGLQDFLKALLPPRSYLPKGSGTNYESYKSTWGLTERTASTTQKMAAGRANQYT